MLELDLSLLKIVEEIKAASKELCFKKHCEFILNQNLSKDIIKDLEFKGVYLIEIKNSSSEQKFTDWVADFENLWLNGLTNDKNSYTPKLIKKRVIFHKQHNQLEEWIPLYIGKSKNIKKRLAEHLFKKLNQPTYSLKLLERENIYNNVFRISAVNIDVKNYDIIMPIIESELRKHINPILGRQ